VRALLAILAAALVALAVGGCASAGLGDGAGPGVTPAGERTAAPAFAVPALAGSGEVSLAEMRGRPVVLNFWASWCGPCTTEMPDFERYSRENPDVSVVGLAVNDAPADSRAFARSIGVSYALGVDRPGAVADEYGTTGLPTTVVIDPQGRVAVTWSGPIDAETLGGLVDDARA
jgi:peroxiredoxin